MRRLLILKGGFEKICQQWVELIKKLVEHSKLVDDKILGVGLAVAGLVKGETGIIEYSSMFKWKKVNLQEELKNI